MLERAPAVDAGTKTEKNDAGPTSSEGGASSIVDSGASNFFGDISFGPTEFDSFERDDLLGGGPLHWSVETSGNPDGEDVYGWEGCDSSVCSKANVAWCSNNDGGSAYLSTNLQSTTKIVRFDFSMALGRESYDTRGHAQLVSFMLENDRFIFLEVLNTTLRLGDQYKDVNGSYQSDFTPVGEVPDNKWSKYRLYLDLSGGVVALQKDGVESGRRTLRPEAITKLQKARIGITFVEYDNFRMRFDDIGLKERTD